MGFDNSLGSAKLWQTDCLGSHGFAFVRIWIEFWQHDTVHWIVFLLLAGLVWHGEKTQIVKSDSILKACRGFINKLKWNIIK